MTSVNFSARNRLLLLLSNNDGIEIKIKIKIKIKNGASAMTLNWQFNCSRYSEKQKIILSSENSHNVMSALTGRSFFYGLIWTYGREHGASPHVPI